MKKRKKSSGLSDNFGIVDGNVMSLFEVGDALCAMLRSIKKMPRKQIIAALQEFGYEPEGGFTQASKEQLAQELLSKRVVGTKLRMILGPDYSS